MPDPPHGEIRAAGAVMWRPAAGDGQVALIHRRRYDDWSLPKGKREPGEHLLVTAVREVAEETGALVTLGRPLGPACYHTDGRRKRVDYWAGHCRQPPAAFVPNDEVDELDWLAVPAARGRLTYQYDIQVLDRFADGPARTTPCILLRHATAGRKAAWHANDLARPLDRRGADEAESLAALLSCFGPCRVISSAAERCVATVRPYAAAAGAQIELEPLFTPGARDGETAEAAGRAAELAGAGTPVLICAHRENLPLLLDAACARLGSSPPEGSSLRKGGFWVLQSAAGSLVSAEHHHPAEN
jgi:8-oxo-dGTP diphosphatase